VTAVRSARPTVAAPEAAAVACAFDFDFAVDDDSTWLNSARSA
jgi:hypothetical protein